MSPVPNFAYTTGNPDNLVGGTPAVMTDIQGPFYDVRAYLNANIVAVLNALSPPSQVLTAAPVLDVGVLNQIRAGRQLTLADFTALGLSAPAGLWNLSDLTDVSGNARALVNKGGVSFAAGINGLPVTAAQFIGSAGQALYRADTGVADPFRITTGSWGCWFRTAKRGTEQVVLSKFGAAGARSFLLEVAGSNVAALGISSDGTSMAFANGVSDVADDRWHHAVATSDGATARIYVDGVLERAIAASLLFVGAAPLNIGALSADGATAAGASHYGRVDEAFVTADVLSEDQIRILYAARIVHGLTSAPRSANLNVNRRRKGATLAAADFTTTPLRLYNFNPAPAFYTDEGSNGQALAWQGGTSFDSCAGADGRQSTALTLTAGSLAATDAGLPTACGRSSMSTGDWSAVPRP
jgi:hypothetical protein